MLQQTDTGNNPDKQAEALQELQKALADHCTCPARCPYCGRLKYPNPSPYPYNPPMPTPYPYPYQGPYWTTTC